jgi:putative toxin-antitoxin system antitoxin component (TIGR02293 family)
MIPAKQVAEVLGGQPVLGQPVESLMDLDEVVAHGIPRAALDALIARLSERTDEVTAISLRHRIIPRATYQRSKRLNQQYSETAERIARVYAIVLDLWQDEDTARAFLLTPHPELRGRTPLDAALTEIGGRQVEEIIERGVHGLPA